MLKKDLKFLKTVVPCNQGSTEDLSKEVPVSALCSESALDTSHGTHQKRDQKMLAEVQSLFQGPENQGLWVKYTHACFGKESFTGPNPIICLHAISGSFVFQHQDLVQRRPDALQSLKYSSSRSNTTERDRKGTSVSRTRRTAI